MKLFFVMFYIISALFFTGNLLQIFQVPQGHVGNHGGHQGQEGVHQVVNEIICCYLLCSTSFRPSF